jgi:hypothetical protein
MITVTARLMVMTMAAVAATAMVAAFLPDRQQSTNSGSRRNGGGNDKGNCNSDGDRNEDNYGKDDDYGKDDAGSGGGIPVQQTTINLM